MILPRHLTPFASTMHERDDLVVQQCIQFMFQFPSPHVCALASFPAVSGDSTETLVPAESTTKTQFAALKQPVSHSEHGGYCEHHSLVVAHAHAAHAYDHGHRPAPAQSHHHLQQTQHVQQHKKHVQTTSWTCT